MRVSGDPGSAEGGWNDKKPQRWECKGGDTWGNRAEREVRNGKGKREGGSGSGICRGRRRMDGLGEEEWG